jgi:iron(III) transport system substrate-binding protein
VRGTQFRWFERTVLSRRGLLRLAGGGAAVSLVAACSSAPVAAPASAPAGPTRPPTPAPTTPPGSGAASEFAVNIEAAKKEGKVVGYGVLIDSQWKALDDLAKAKLGIPVENFRAPSARIVSRVDTEKGSGQHLVDFIVAESIYVDAWAKAGFVNKLPAALLNRVPEKWRDPNGYYVVFTLFPTTVIYNKKLVSEADAPKSMDDLLNPRWKGKIAMTDPTLNETFLRWFYVERQKRGEDKAREYFTRLGAQGPTMFESGLTVSTNVNEGQFPVGIGFMTHVLSVGGPTGNMAYMKQDPMPAGNAAFTLASKAPHPEAQNALAELFLSRDYLQASGDLGYPITVPGVKSALPGADDLKYEELPDLPRDKFDENVAFLNATLKK